MLKTVLEELTHRVERDLMAERTTAALARKRREGSASQAWRPSARGSKWHLRSIQLALEAA